eukprot:8434743-Alexandrium_andersonii.AAC.1
MEGDGSPAGSAPGAGRIKEPAEQRPVRAATDGGGGPLPRAGTIPRCNGGRGKPDRALCCRGG